MTNGIRVIVVSYRCAEHVRRCLESLSALPDTKIEICVVENGGPRAFSALVECIGSGETLSEPNESGFNQAVRVQDARCPLYLFESACNYGYAGAINRVIAFRSDFDWQFIWILNPDLSVTPDALTHALKKAIPGQFSVVGSRIIDQRTGKIQSVGGKWRKISARGFDFGRGDDFRRVFKESDVELSLDYVSGACMLVSRSYIQDVGLMDERYFLFCEEVDWCLRRGAHKIGYAHNSGVQHEHGATIGSSNSRRSESRLAVYLSERNKLLMTKKLFPNWYPLTALVAFLLLFRYVVKWAPSNFLVGLSGWNAGLHGLTGIPDAFSELMATGGSNRRD